MRLLLENLGLMNAIQEQGCEKITLYRKNGAKCSVVHFKFQEMVQSAMHHKKYGAKFRSTPRLASLAGTLASSSTFQNEIFPILRLNLFFRLRRQSGCSCRRQAASDLSLQSSLSLAALLISFWCDGEGRVEEFGYIFRV